MELHSKIHFFEDLQDKAQKEISFGVYVHVPFCASTCDFCSFYQETPHRQDLLKYLQTIRTEFAPFSSDRPVETVFWGGGTPGLLPPSDIEFLGNAQLETLGVPLREWTVEMAPSTVKPDKLKVLKDLGVDRISLGVQSFQEEMLEALGRRQSPRQVLEAYDLIRSAGFQNVNIDLIFAVPNQTMEIWLRDLEKTRELAPDHVSTYCLTLEEDTALYLKLAKARHKMDPGREADFYERTWEVLHNMVLQQYEISNFSRPGMACLHNLNTWRMHEWIGFGPSASSQYMGRRFTNTANLDEWAQGLLEKKPVFTEDSELSSRGLALDTLIFGLRMNEGVDLFEIRERFPEFESFTVDPFLEGLVDEGLAESSGGRFSLTLKGRLLADRIGAELLGCNDI